MLHAHPAALPLHLLSALLSIIAHTPGVPQGTAFCREPAGIICNLGVKWVVTAGTAREESSVTFATLQRVLQAVPGQASSVARTSKHSDKAEVLPRALCRLMLSPHLHGAGRTLPGHTSSGHLWPSNRDCQQENPEAFSAPEFST